MSPTDTPIEQLCRQYCNELPTHREINKWIDLATALSSEKALLNSEMQLIRQTVGAGEGTDVPATLPTFVKVREVVDTVANQKATIVKLWTALSDLITSHWAYERAYNDGCGNISERALEVQIAARQHARMVLIETQPPIVVK